MDIEAAKSDIRKGIAAYSHEQEVFRRLLRKRGRFTACEFDNWFQGREYRRRMPLRGGGLSGDSFILGLGMNGGNVWAERLELLQMMIRLGEVETERVNGVLTYTNPKNGH